MKIQISNIGGALSSISLSTERAPPLRNSLHISQNRAVLVAVTRHSVTMNSLVIAIVRY